MKEIWKDIIGFDTFYQVSNLGHVRSILVRRGSQARRLKPTGTGRRHSGYLAVTLSKNNKSVKLTVHRLVGTAFIPNPDNLPQINHKNGKKSDNRVTNLEWCSNSQNLLHAYRVLGRRSPDQSGDNNANCRRSNEVDKLMRKAHRRGETAASIGRRVGISYDYAWQICAGLKR